MKYHSENTRIIGWLTVIILALVNLGFGDTAADRVKEGNRLYRKGEYDQALKSYGRAQLEKPESAPIFFNIGDVHYRKEELDKAGSLFQKSLEAGDTEMSSRAAYNLGNTLYRKGDLEGALKAYKESIRLDPSDFDAKYNYELARKQLKEQQQKQQQEQKQQQKDREQGKEEKEDKQQKNKEEEKEEKKNQEKKESDQRDEKKEQEKPEKENKKSEEQKEKEQSKQSKPQPSPKGEEEESAGAAGQEEKMDPEDVKRLLNAIRAEEEQQREMMLRERQGKPPEVLKDW